VNRIHLLAAGLAVLALVTSTRAPSAAVRAGASAVYAMDLTYMPMERPRTLMLNNHDAVHGLRWRQWGAAVASATGTVRIDTCRPVCATGRAERHVAGVRLAGVRTCQDGHRYYTRLRLRYSGRGQEIGTLTPPCS